MKRIIAAVGKVCVPVIVGMVSSSAPAAVRSYVWDGTSETYGEDVTVTYSSGPGSAVSRIDAVARTGDSVVFTGSQASFAANAALCLKGLGSIVLSNDVATAGALKLTTDFSGNTVDLGTTLMAGQTVTVDLAAAGVFEAETLTLADFSIAGGKYMYNTTDILKFYPYFEKRTADEYTVQLQGFNGAWTKCFKVSLKIQGGQLKATCVYAKTCTVWTRDLLGQDFDQDLPDVTDISKYNPNYVKELVFRAMRTTGRRNVVFAGKFTSGGELKVQDGVNFKVTGDGIGAKDCATIRQAVTFNRGSFELVDAGVFTNQMSIAGSDGELVFSSSDAAPPVPTVVNTELTISTTPKVVLPGTALSSILSVTGEVSFLKYNSTTEYVALESAYKKPIGAMFFRNIGNELIARFQVRTSEWMAYGGGICFRQSGTNVTAHVCCMYDQWYQTDPACNDPWTWDYFNSGKPTDRNHGNEKFIPKNLSFVLGGRMGTPATPTHMYYALNAASGTARIRHVFRPGANRKMAALVTGQLIGTEQVEVCDGATLEFRDTNHNVAHLGIWPSQATTMIVYAGGRVYADRNWQTSVYQTIDLQGGKFATRDPDYDSAGQSGYAFFKGKTAIDYLHGVRYSDGARSCGYDVYLGHADAPDTELTVTGATPCTAENGFLVGGSSVTTGTEPCTLTLDVADVTSSADVDFTLVRPLRQSASTSWVRLCKTGAGTVLMSAKNNFFTNAPIVLKEGAVRMGAVQAFNADTDFAFEGGALEAGVAGTYSLGEVALADDSTLALTDGVTVRFAASAANDWTSGKTLNVTGDMTKSAVYFGTGAQGLTERQQRRLRLNGQRCRLDDEGKIVPGGYGLMLMIR